MPRRVHAILFVLIGALPTGCGTAALLDQDGDVLVAGQPEGDPSTPGGTGDGSMLDGDEPAGEPVATDSQSDVGEGADDGTVPAPEDEEPPIIETPGGQSIDPFVPDTVDPIDGPFLDPFGQPQSDPLLIGELVPFWIDGFLLDILDPADDPSTGISDSYSHLELLCRDRELPVTYCRRRYGD